jgi:methyl-accepting chemotaxis protein
VKNRNLIDAGISWTLGLLVACILLLGVQAVFRPLGTGWAAALSLLALVLVAALAWTLRVRVSRPLASITAAAQSLAAGDLADSSQAAMHAGQLGELALALGEVKQRMFGMIAGVRARTSSIASTSALMTSDNAALSSRTDAQAASLEETASSMDQLAATVRQNAEHARQASAMVTATHDSAMRGRGVVQQVVHNMGGIKERSAQVADIISVIDGIAFQTNILALNAAVEAARAGEQGRGFAVVAGEVRTLAERAAVAAREIKTLITGSVQQVDAGSVLVADAGRAMNEIVANVEQVTRLVADIAAATTEQSAGIEEINRSVVHIDGMTQQNAALVQELARTAEGMREEAEQLTQVASAFRLGDREFGSAEEAVQLVRAAVEYARTQGPTALVADVRKLAAGQFIDRDLYLSVYHSDGRVAAHGASRRFWDIDWKPLKDADGRMFVADMVAGAFRAGSGWTDYKWVHPLSKQEMLKSAYFERCGDLVIACGVFKGGAQGMRSQRARQAPAPTLQLLPT